MQGNPAALRLRYSARRLTDGGGLVLLRRLWDAVGLGRWLRRCREALLPLLDQLLCHLVPWRWRLVGTPTDLTLLLDSTVVVRYGTHRTGAELGYHPKKPGRPSHHPLLAFAKETGDCLGVI